MKPSTQAWILGLLAAGCLLALVFGPTACKADSAKPISQRLADAAAVFAAGAVTGPHDSLSVEVDPPRVPVPAT